MKVDAKPSDRGTHRPPANFLRCAHTLSQKTGTLKIAIRYRGIFVKYPSKTNVFEQCVLPVINYGSKTWSLTMGLTRRLRVTQRAMERAMLRVSLRDQKCSDIAQRERRNPWNLELPTKDLCPAVDVGLPIR
ncbi:jg6259 [Pararge aegeria aegeria]|uniref:Jg6259 protein n=1 Tax=Pararge aegeria aegeria TaxID=348720 RepID=A0A8S4QJJ7_9NEOP|nr:jg6259 [Pararge aegeria aegeria]